MPIDQDKLGEPFGTFATDLGPAWRERPGAVPGHARAGRMTPASGRPLVRDILSRASSRDSVPPGDGRSGAAYERVTVDGTAYFVKQLSPSSDWVMRVTGDRVQRPYLVWQAGIMGRAPGCIDHTVVGMDLDGTDGDAVLTILMRDVGGFLVPPGDTVVPLGQHAGFVAHMAALAAAFWGWADDIGLTTMAQRLRCFAPGTIAAELSADQVPGPLAAAAAGWPALAARSPSLSGLARHVHDDPEVLAARLRRLPGTFIHGDWKMGNLGRHPNGQTILLDWTLPGAGPACWDLCWYLALNQARLPEPKEAVIARYRSELENHGIATGGWWQEQLDLCLIGIMATFGWEKALGDAAELSWWEATVTGAATRQHIPIPRSWSMTADHHARGRGAANPDGQHRGLAGAPDGRSAYTADELLIEARASLPRRPSPAEALAAQARGALLIDIRGDDQRRACGLIPGALLLPRNALEWRCDPTGQWRHSAMTGRDQHLILICQEGFQSSLAAATLQRLGLVNATDIDGGFAAWATAGLPVVARRRRAKTIQ